jgi:transposase
MKKLTKEEREKIIHTYKEGSSLRELAEATGVAKSSIQRILKENSMETIGTRRGPKRKLSLRKERFMIKKFQKRELLSTQEASTWMKKNLDIAISKETVRKVLQNNGLRCYKKAKKPFLNKSYISKRMKFARFHSKWTFFDWKKVIFSDESKFNLHGSDGHPIVWCNKGDSLRSENVESIRKFGGGGLMAWGCITFSGVGKILKVSHKINAEEYREVLNKGLIKTLDMHNLDFSNTVFMHDNAPCHTSASVKEWLKAQHVKVLDWPANSPDMNPIEHVWKYLEKRVRTYSLSSSSLEELWVILEREWYKIPKDYIESLYISMCERVEAIIRAKGGNTRF